MDDQIQVPFDSRLKNKTNVAAVETRPFNTYSFQGQGENEESIPMRQPSHWNQNGQVYMEIGIGLADAMNSIMSNSNKTLARCSGRNVRYEAEIQDCKNQCEVKTALVKGSVIGGYTGSGYVNLKKGDGSEVNWNDVRVSDSGSYKLKFKIPAESSDEPLPLNGVKVHVNNKTYDNLNIIDIEDDLQWSDWNRFLQVESVDLAGGSNSISVKSNGVEIKIDYLIVE